MPINFYLSYSWLRWTKPAGPPLPVPEDIQRFFIKTPGGNIEVLCAKPSVPSSGAAPIVFAHGGMGAAAMWVPYMQYLAANGITSYAVSTRGHGASWHPSYFRMLFTTTKRMLTDDLVAGIKEVEKREGSEVVLVGHSSGGGLSQYILNEGFIKVRGLALLGAVPGTGSIGVYRNWAAFDPWFSIRLILHGWHSNSPLSHPFLVRRAFFSDELPESELLEFMKHVNSYESFLWPFGMMRPFVDGKKLLGNIAGWGTGERVLIMAGSGDRLMTHDVQQKSAEFYRAKFSEMVRDKQIEAKDDAITAMAGEGGQDNSGHGVRLAFVPGSGHHLQNDVTWKVGASKLLAFLQQL